MILPPESKGERFDQAIAQLASGASVREVRIALKEGRILIDGRKRAPGDRARGGETIDLARFSARSEAVVEGEPDLLARVLFEDDSLLALDKPSGMQTAPLRAGERGTLLSAAIARAPEIASAGPPLEGGLVHRLDRDTSGVVIFAKTNVMREELRTAFSAHRVQKRYLAWVCRTDLPDRFTVESWIAQAGERVKQVEREHEGALHAITELEVRRRGKELTLVEAKTFTGRRHQIRVHLASEGAPIAGDPIYGDAKTAPRLALHASRIQLPDRRTIDAPLPPDLEKLG